MAPSRSPFFSRALLVEIPPVSSSRTRSISSRASLKITFRVVSLIQGYLVRSTSPYFRCSSGTGSAEGPRKQLRGTFTSRLPW
ncbi:MAG: hypothetical protein ACOX8X_02565 [Methanomethylophilus sp.]|jgi:hypothetical protein